MLSYPLGEFDILAVLVKYLSENLPCPVSTSVPSVLPDRFVVVYMIGSSREQIRYDDSRISIDVWVNGDDDPEAEAFRLMNKVRNLMDALPSEYAGIPSVSESMVTISNNPNYPTYAKYEGIWQVFHTI